MSTLDVRLGQFSSRDTTILRAGALVAALLLMVSYLSAMYFVVDVVGNPRALLFVVGATLVVATILSRFVSVRVAVVLSVLLLVGGLAYYLTQLPNQVLAFGPHLQYIMALVSGHSILEIVNLKTWVLAVTPGPVFLTWYLALRRRYGSAALVGGATVGFFILTGDATFPVAMVGSIGALALLGLGALERADATLAHAEVVSIVLAVVVVASLSVTVVPAGAQISYSPSTGFIAGPSAAGGGSANTVEASLLSNSESFQVQGSIELSPKVRWTVESDGGDYWRVGTYDLYTGDGWIRRAETSADRGPLRSPPGETRRISQTFTAESAISTMPAAWRPTAIEGEVEDRALVTDFGSLKPAGPLQAGDSYTVTSEIPIATSTRLQNAGTDYPDDIEERFTQLPDSTPERVGKKTERLTALAETPYETALTIENWLENEREYSLDVEAPGDNVAEEFLFERQRGYCVYFATTMAVMLRTQGIPARMVTGYTTGERVDQDKWVVRGYNSHAWVEAYFPSVGWVRFDPTPSGPRESVEGQSLEDARAENESNVDTDDTLDPQYTTPSSTEEPNRSAPWLNGSNGGNGGFLTARENLPGDDVDLNGSITNDTTTTTAGNGGGESEDEDEDGEGLISLDPPSREEVIFGTVAALGLVAGVRRTRATERIYRGVWLRWQPRDDPATDIERAYDRLLYLLARENRDQRSGETVRQYLDAIDADERAWEVAQLRERSHYGGRASQADADRAVTLVDQLVGDR